MSEKSGIQNRFDTWVASNEAASVDTFFLYHQWVEHIDVPVIAHRESGEIVYMNSAAGTLLGQRRRDALGSNIGTILGEDWYAQHVSSIASTTAVDTGFSTELRMGRPVRHFQIVTTVVFDSTEQPGLVWLVMRDVTELVNAHDDLRNVNQQLQESNRDLEDFAYVASHDLQEPLRKILAFGERLRMSLGADADERSLDYLDRMDNASRRMQTLINDLLSFSRVSTKGNPLVPVDLNLVIAHVLEDLEIAVSDAEAIIHVGTMPTVDGDALQLRQLVQNLLGNALKFRAPGRQPEIWLESALMGGRWLLSVRDNGIGFDPTYAEKIFTVFQRLHGRAQFEGTGVGLAICRRIVERHDGSIRAVSTPDDGATFVIDLPRSQSELRRAA